MAKNPSRTSAQSSFHPINAKGDDLFSVNAGVPVADALIAAKCFLSSALEVATDEATTDKSWAVVHLIKMAQAVVSDCAEVMETEDSNRA